MTEAAVTGWLVTGAGGMLGRELAGLLAAESAPVLLADHAALDVTDTAAVHDMVAQLGHRGVVLNAAGWTNVDAAEENEAAALAVNGAAVRALASACSDIGATLVHVSTDYVFGGAPSGGVPGAYAEDAPSAPINAYGRSKLVGEQAVLQLCPASGYVLRTAWLYGRHGRNFVSTMLGLAERHDTVSVVDDQVGQPTWTLDLAGRMVEMGQHRPKAGIYHATAQGETSWYGLACAAFTEAGLDPDRVIPVHTDAFPRPAPRPARSVLGHDAWTATGLPSLGPWRAMLTRAFGAGTFVD